MPLPGEICAFKKEVLEPSMVRRLYPHGPAGPHLYLPLSPLLCPRGPAAWAAGMGQPQEKEGWPLSGPDS